MRDFWSPFHSPLQRFSLLSPRQIIFVFISVDSNFSDVDVALFLQIIFCSLLIVISLTKSTTKHPLLYSMLILKGFVIFVNFNCITIFSAKIVLCWESSTVSRREHLQGSTARAVLFCQELTSAQARQLGPSGTGRRCGITLPLATEMQLARRLTPKWRVTASDLESQALLTVCKD